MDKENENNASVEGITTAVFCREGDLKQFTDVFARLGRSCTAAQKGGIDEAQAWLTQHDAPGLLIVDISASPFPVPALADLAALAGPGCRIVAVGAEENVELYRSLLSAGAFDYLVSPVADALVVELLNRADSDRWLGMPDASSVRVGQTIAVTGAAGGAGTSTVAALLGRWIAEAAKYPTLLVDFDRRKGDLALLLGLKADNGLAGILSAAEIDYRLIAARCSQTVKRSACRSLLSVPVRKRRLIRSSSFSWAVRFANSFLFRFGISRRIALRGAQKF